MEVLTNNRREFLPFYSKENGDVFVFDSRGNCFRCENTLDNVEKVREEVIDTERVAAPMSGMVVSLRGVEGKEFKKVTFG